MTAVSHEGWLYFLRALTGLEQPDTFCFRLFTNDVTPTEDSRLSDFTECPIAGGYAPYEIPASAWTGWADGRPTASFRWVFDGEKDLDVRGWYLTCGHAFVMGQRFTNKGRSETQKVRRRGDWIEATATLARKK